VARRSVGHHNRFLYPSESRRTSDSRRVPTRRALAEVGTQELAATGSLTGRHALLGRPEHAVGPAHLATNGNGPRLPVVSEILQFGPPDEARRQSAGPQAADTKPLKLQKSRRRVPADKAAEKARAGVSTDPERSFHSCPDMLSETRLLVPGKPSQGGRRGVD
jgi:hypothetical protein